MGPQYVDKFLHRNLQGKSSQNQVGQKAATCMEASRGSVDLSLFICEPRG